MRWFAIAVLCAACGRSADAPAADAEVLAVYDGTLVVHPHGSMYSQTSNIAVELGTTSALADDCTLGNMTNHDGTLTFACGGGQCACAMGSLLTIGGTLEDPMLALHWTKLAFEDEAVDYDFTGTRE